VTALDEAARAQLREFSPVRHAVKELPPMLLIAGTADRLIEQQRAYAKALTSAGARVEAVEIDGAPHGMEAWNEDSAWRVWEKAVGDWIAARVH
jgi:acetyl esterase/lipase